MSYPGMTSRSSHFISMNSKITDCATSSLYESPQSAYPSRFSTFSKPDYCNTEVITRDGTSERKSRSRTTRSVKNSSYENQSYKKTQKQGCMSLPKSNWSCDNAVTCKESFCSTRGISADRIRDLDKALSSGYSDPLCGMRESPCVKRHYNEGDHIGTAQYPSNLFKTNDTKETKEEPKQLNEDKQNDTENLHNKISEVRFKNVNEGKGTTVSGDRGGKKSHTCPCCGNEVTEITCNNRLCSSLLNLQNCLLTKRMNRKQKDSRSKSPSIKQQYDKTNKDSIVSERHLSGDRATLEGRPMNEFGQYAFQERGKDGKMHTVYRDTFKVDEDLLRERNYAAAKSEKPKDLKNVYTMTYSGEDNILGTPTHDKQVLTVLNFSNMDLTTNFGPKGGAGPGMLRNEPRRNRMACIATQTMFPPSDKTHKPKTPVKRGGGMQQIKPKLHDAQTQTDFELLCVKCKGKTKVPVNKLIMTSDEYPGQTVMKIIWGKASRFISFFGRKQKYMVDKEYSDEYEYESDEDEEAKGRKQPKAQSKQAKYRRKQKAPPPEPEPDKKGKDKKGWFDRAKMFIEPDDGAVDSGPMFSLDEIMQDVITETPWVEKKQGGTWFQGFGGMGTIEENKTASNIYSQGTQVVPVFQNNVRVLEWANYFSFVWNRPWIRYNENSEINLIPWGLLKNNQTQRQYLLNKGQHENAEEGPSLSEEIRAGNHAVDLDYFQFPLSFKHIKSETYEVNSKLHRKTSSKQFHLD